MHQLLLVLHFFSGRGGGLSLWKDSSFPLIKVGVVSEVGVSSSEGRYSYSWQVDRMGTERLFFCGSAGGRSPLDAPTVLSGTTGALKRGCAEPGDVTGVSLRHSGRGLRQLLGTVGNGNGSDTERS